MRACVGSNFIKLSPVPNATFRTRRRAFNGEIFSSMVFFHRRWKEDGLSFYFRLRPPVKVPFFRDVFFFGGESESLTFPLSSFPLLLRGGLRECAHNGWRPYFEFFFEGIANVLYIYTYIKNHLDICPHYCAYSLLIFVYSFVWDTLAKWIHCTNSPTWSICIKNIGDFWFFNFSFIENNYVSAQFCINNTYPHWRRVHIKHAAI